jgi:hypothetical protein
LLSKLTPIGDVIWLVEGSLVDFYGFPYPTRSVVVKLQTGDLWIWSPVELTSALQEDLAALGPVAHLVSPNKIHHLYLQNWLIAYPAAKLWGPASTARKRPDLEFAGELTDESPAQWHSEIAQFWFHGSPALDEIVFVHLPSRTAIIADLSENFSEGFLNLHWRAWQRVIARLWKITEPFGYAPLELRLSWFRRRSARRALHRLLNTDPLQVVMAHGQWQSENGRAYLEQAFAWLDNTAKSVSG